MDTMRQWGNEYQRWQWCVTFTTNTPEQLKIEMRKNIWHVSRRKRILWDNEEMNINDDNDVWKSHSHPKIFTQQSYKMQSINMFWDGLHLSITIERFEFQKKVVDICKGWKGNFVQCEWDARKKCWKLRKFESDVRGDKRSRRWESDSESEKNRFGRGENRRSVRSESRISRIRRWCYESAE